MHKHRLSDRTIVYTNAKNLLESTVLVCREFADPRIRRWCVMTRDTRKCADNWDAWTSVGDYRTKGEAVIHAVGLLMPMVHKRADSVHAAAATDRLNAAIELSKRATA